MLDTGGHPMLHGRFEQSSDYPTVTVYNHLDVQPAEIADGWHTEPFRFIATDDRYWGRGTTDDKGPALTALWGAKYALAHGARVNIHFLWEAEEEIGSPHFESTIKQEKDRLHTDSVVVSDTVWVSRVRPACPAGLRGLQGFRFVLETGETDQHSGTSGGAARNPVAELCQLIADCFDAKTGEVKIPGFYDDVIEPTKAEIRDLKKSGFSTQNVQEGSSVQVASRDRSGRSHETDLLHADVRGARDRRGLPRSRSQDRRSTSGHGHRFLPLGAGHGRAQDRQDREAVFAVGTALTGGPPHRSQRALLTHWAPTSGHDAQSLFGIRVQCSMLDDFHQPSVVDGIEESTDVRVEYPVHFLSEPCSLIPAGYLPYPLQRISQIRGPNVGALPWLFPRFPASCPFRVVHIHSLPGAESGT